MKNVMLCGYYGEMNTGDDALLAVAGWGVRNFLDASHIVASASRIPQISNKKLIKPIFPPQRCLRGEKLLRYFWHARRAQCIFSGGGSMFRSSLYMRLLTSLMTFARPGPHAAIGISIGPFRDAGAEKVCARLLDRLDFVGVRDQESLEIAHAIAPDARVRKTFDLALLLPQASGSSIERLQSETERKGTGFALCNWERFNGRDRLYEKARLDKIITAINALDPEDTGEIILIDFNGHPRFGDHGLNCELKNRISPRFKVRHVGYNSNPMQVLEQISRLKALVSMRLHASVFGYIADTPTLIISYQPKCIGWAEQIGMDKGYLMDSNDIDPEELTAKISELVTINKRTYSLDPVTAEKLALDNWTWLYDAISPGYHGKGVAGNESK